MVNRKPYYSIRIFFSCLILFFSFLLPKECFCSPDWQTIDARAEMAVLQLNVGLKAKLQNNYWLRAADISTKKNYYVFTSGAKDLGFEVVGRGSTFPIHTDNNQNTYFVTNRHVLDNARQMSEECEIFYAAAMYYANNHMSGNKRFERLLNIINLANKSQRNSAENKLYQGTVNDIWDCYDNKLSKSADPSRVLFDKYKRLAPVVCQPGYFLHVANSDQLAIEAKVYKLLKAEDPDLAILVARVPSKIKSHAIITEGLPAEFKIVQNEELHLLGYPVIDNMDQVKVYRPTFSFGKVSKIETHTFEFEGDISKGDSGGPVVNKDGKAIGIITNRAITLQGLILSTKGSAIKMEELKSFAPELFESHPREKNMRHTVRFK